ncbi:MAG: DNA polymerase III subunit delta [Patescibacteria group bacterium]
MVIFLYGPDTYRSKERLKELIDSFKKKRDQLGLSVIKLEGKNLTLDEFRKTVLPTGLFSTKRLIIIENLLSQNKDKNLIKEIVIFLKKKLEKENVVIFYETEEIKKEEPYHSLFNLLRKQKYVYEFNFLEGLALRNWIIKEVKKIGGQISPPAIDYLVLYFGSNLWEIKNEIDKALAYGQGKIEKKTLEIISEKKEEEEIFALIDALINKNKKKAIKLLENELAKGTSFSYILSLLANQFRIILSLKEQKRIFNYYQIAKELGVHPYPVKKAFEQMKRYNLEELKKIYQELLKIDLQLKTSGLKPELLFDLLIAKL